MKLNNDTYNKTKLVHELGSIAWFLEKHAIKDAQAAKDKDCVKVLQDLEKDLHKHISQLQQALHCGCE
jgi:hypothetical protein